MYRSLATLPPSSSIIIIFKYKIQQKGHQYMTHIADSAQTEYCSTFHCSCVRPCVTGVTSHISHIYKGINAMLIIRGPIKPYKFWIKIILAIFLAKTRPDKTIFSALTNLTIDFDWSKNYQKDKCRIRIVYFVLLSLIFKGPSFFHFQISQHFQLCRVYHYQSFR